MRVDDASRWGGDLVDVGACLRRVGYPETPPPTLAVLRALHRGHVTSFPFENLDALLGVPVALDVPSVQRKLERERRGGYCYEHVTLFAAVLERLGFRFTALSARVTLGSRKILPATHALLAVRAADDERTWLCDVGFGSGPLEPVELADGAEASADGWRYRLERRPGTAVGALAGHDAWWLHELGAQGWTDRHTFTLNPQYPADFAVGSHYVSTSTRSPFTRRLFVQRFAVDRHDVLDGAVWTTTLPDGTRTERKIQAEELAETLRQTFGIVPGEATLARLGNSVTSA